MLTGNVFHQGFLHSFEETKLDFSTGCLVVQEMLTHWPKIVAYIGSTGPL